jgi:LemA protein
MYVAIGIAAFLAILTMIVVIGFGVYAAMLYNRIVRRENKIDDAYGSIQANLKKRHDLIPNLVSTVQQYTDYESGTLEEIVELRNLAVSGDLSENEQQEVESQMTQALDKLMVQVEDYPDLQASENFLQLQRSLNEVEEQLSASRRFYNTAVKRYNDSIETFPGNLIAREFGFEERDVFEAEVHEHKTPDIDALFEK